MHDTSVKHCDMHVCACACARYSTFPCTTSLSHLLPFNLHPMMIYHAGDVRAGESIHEAGQILHLFYIFFTTINPTAGKSIREAGQSFSKV